MNVLDAASENARLLTEVEKSTKLAIEKIKAALALNLEQQQMYTKLQPAWFVHERVDDHLFSALTALGD